MVDKDSLHRRISTTVKPLMDFTQWCSNTWSLESAKIHIRALETRIWDLVDGALCSLHAMETVFFEMFTFSVRIG